MTKYCCIKIHNFLKKECMSADTYALDHGLGDYILATKEFILTMGGISKGHIRRIKKLYLPPEEIMDIMLNRISEDP